MRPFTDQIQTHSREVNFEMSMGHEVDELHPEQLARLAFFRRDARQNLPIKRTVEANGDHKQTRQIYLTRPTG